MAKETWRDMAARVIADVLNNTKGLDERTIRTDLYHAYPFGERKYHPYKVWLDEIRRQRGLPRLKLRSTKSQKSKYVQLELPL